MELRWLEFERALAYHCGPAMAGIKASDLFSWPLASEDRINAYAHVLEQRGISLRVLRRSRRLLLLVYRPPCLARCLACPRVRTMLQAAGYPALGNPEDLLNVLIHRLQQEGFPHEIGLFLGYPPEDVEGFCRNKGQNYKLCGRWKVYGDQDAAARYFRRCDCCRDALCRSVARRPLADIFPLSPLAVKGAALL